MPGTEVFGIWDLGFASEGHERGIWDLGFGIRGRGEGETGIWDLGFVGTGNGEARDETRDLGFVECYVVCQCRLVQEMILVAWFLFPLYIEVFLFCTG